MTPKILGAKTVMDAAHSPLRIYQEDPTPSLIGVPDPYRVAAAELLRPAGQRPGHTELEPFSRAWFEEIEIKRYTPHGAWLRRVLEFTRHPGQNLLMLGAGLGTDALQYHRHGVEVTVAAGPADSADLVRKNFELRGLPLRVVHLNQDFVLPFERGKFDLAYLNLLHAGSPDPSALTEELYRVLKPGGKAFVLAPARYDAGFWQHLLLPVRRWYRPPSKFSESPRYSGRALKQIFHRFTEPRTAKRHLRRSELPHLWRFVPAPVLERLMGRVMVLRAFKPISAVHEALSIEAAA